MAGGWPILSASNHNPFRILGAPSFLPVFGERMGKARQILTRGNIPIRSRLRPLRLDLHYTFFARLTSFRRSCERVGAKPVPPPRGSSLEMEIYPAFRAKRWRSMLGYHVSSRGAGLGWRCFSICTADPSETGRVAQPNTSGVPALRLRSGQAPSRGCLVYAQK